MEELENNDGGIMNKVMQRKCRGTTRRNIIIQVVFDEDVHVHARKLYQVKYKYCMKKPLGTSYNYTYQEYRSNFQLGE